MNKFDDGLTQVLMARIADVAPATISRYISKHGIEPLPANGKRNIKYSIDNSREIVGSIKDKEIILKKCHAFYNFKGGTGKTSLCYQVSTHVALMGYDVLVIDTDPQAHLTSSFDIKGFEQKETLYDCIVKQRNISDLIIDVFPGCKIIPSNLSLTRLEPELNNMARREERLDIALNSIKTKYDFIFIDTNPTISILNRNVIVTSDCLNVVAETQPFSLIGLKYLMEDIEKFYNQMQLNPRN
jgi:chromosome partitioning protein